MRYREYVSTAGDRSGDREKNENNGGWRDERDTEPCFRSRVKRCCTWKAQHASSNPVSHVSMRMNEENYTVRTLYNLYSYVIFLG
jgi:hypothetical protein